MTYIEFFDRTSIENICACLHELPDEVILVGDNASVMNRYIKNYQKVFEGRGQQIKFSYRTVSRWNIDQVVRVLDQIVKEQDECVFGITGGDESVVFALGIICGRYADKNIQVHKISVQKNTIHDCDMDGQTINHYTSTLSVDENIKIYGGEIIYSDVNGGKTYLWDMTSDFREDIEKMWSVCKKDPRAWNKQIGVFETIGKIGSASEDGLTVTVSITAAKEYYKKHTGKYRLNPDVTDKLLEKKLLTALEEDTDADTVTVTYKNLQVKKCLTQAGLALEMKIYMEAKNLVGEDGKPLYCDVMNGVEIDWDGRVHGVEEQQQYPDTTNEIDVLLMHNMVPIFVSCKNGDVTVDELYKLNTVAERFGSKYAKKILISTVLSELRIARNLKQRAQDMGIKVISGADLMNDEALRIRLKNLWC